MSDTTWTKHYTRVVHELDAAQRRIEALEAETATAHMGCTAIIASQREALDHKAEQYAARIEALEAELARVTEERNQYFLRERERQLTIRQMRAQVDALEDEVARPRDQPCDHSPPGSNLDCVLCRLRAQFVQKLADNSDTTYIRWCSEHVMEYFDIAVQAVREGQG